METVRLSYHIQPDGGSDPFGGGPRTGISLDVNRSITEEAIILSDLIEQMGEFILNAGWSFPQGQTLGLVDL